MKLPRTMTMKRRRFLTTTMGAIPMVPGLLSAAPLLGNARRSLIILWMDGGMSHLDTFDGKPEAPPEVRGDLASVESSLEGVFVSEHLPRLSAAMKHCALIRSITSPEGNHDRGSHYMLTGRRPSPVLTYPSYGSVLRKGDNSGTPAGVPPYVAIPESHPYGRQGFLPAASAPFEIGGDPGKRDFKVRDMDASEEGQRARDLLRAVDDLDGGPRSESETARDEFLAQARHLSLDSQVRGLFDLAKETPELRQRYGRSFFGQSCLLARRLVEGGVGTVLVRYKGWDHHRRIASALTYGFPPKLEAIDQGMSALREDLHRRGLLDRVTVFLGSEFGRTPRLNPAGGRDHWSRASSALLFGAGLKNGCVVGKTDARGEEPVERPVTPGDLFHTLLAALGVERELVLHTADGRPVRVVEESTRPVREILAL